ncbi:hypothetical protein VKT23_000141 [Stygiomarasmius scandens]|uniref:Uncharacterized protein n=1 Tax=Marasmiellus scandens TaxID=2682957 RepID=A0ABR1K5T7_9AGAR
MIAVYRLHRKEWEKGSVESQKSNYMASAKKGKTPEPGGVDSDDEGNASEGETKHKKEKKRNLSVDEDATEEGTAREQRRNRPKKPRGREDGRKEFPGGGRRGVSSSLRLLLRGKEKVMKAPFQEVENLRIPGVRLSGRG